MKVNEVITEAPMGVGRLGQWIGKTFQTKKGDEISRDAITAWAEYARKIETAGTDLTYENYEEELNKWLGNWLKLGKPYPGQLTGHTAVAVNRYIVQAVNQRLTDRIPGARPLNAMGSADAGAITKEVLNTLVTKAETLGDKLDYADITDALASSGLEPYQRREATTLIASELGKHGIAVSGGPGGASPGTKDPGAMARDVSVYSSDPVVLQYKHGRKKRLFALNKNNRWVQFPSSGKEVEADQTTQQYLNQQLKSL